MTPYVRDIATLMTGAAVGQLITVLAAPVLTRVYTPRIYGLAAAYLAVVSIVGSVAALRYDMAIVIPDDDKEAVGLLRLSTVLCLGSSLMSGLLILLLDRLGQQPDLLGPVIYFLPLSIFVGGSVNFLSYWATRQRSFSLLARTRILSALLSPFIAVAWALLGDPSPAGLILASLMAFGASAGWLSSTAREQVSRTARAGRISLRTVASRYRRFPKLNLWMTLLDTGTTFLPVLVFGFLFSAPVAAFFSLATVVLRQPAYLVGRAVGDVFFERASRLKDRPSDLRRLTRRNLVALAVIIVTPVVLVVSFGPQLFSLVFGSQWETAGTYARFLILGAAALFIAGPISTLPAILEKQHIHLGISVAAYGLRAVALGVGVVVESPLITVVLYSVGEAVPAGVFVVWLLRHLRNLERSSAGAIRENMGAC